MRQTITCVFSMIVVLSISLGLCACRVKGSPEELSDYDSYMYYTKGIECCQSYELEFGETLDEYGIDYFTKEERDDNTSQTYAQIAGLSESELVVYYNVLGEEESEKIVKLFGYEGWDDFLMKNKYFDEDGKPSMDIWIHNAYIEMGKIYTQGNSAFE